LGDLNVFGNEIARSCSSTDAAGLAETKSEVHRRSDTKMAMIWLYMMGVIFGRIERTISSFF
jgi:hypothetical protein